MENILLFCFGKTINVKKFLDQMRLQIQKQALCTSYAGQTDLGRVGGESRTQTN